MYQVFSNWLLYSILPSSIHLLFPRWIKIYYVFYISYKFCCFPLDFNSFVSPRAWSSKIRIGYSLSSGEQRGIVFSHFTCNVSVNKTFAILRRLTHFAIHYYPCIWFCSTYTYLFLILHLHVLYLALSIILCLVHYRSLLQFIKIFEWLTFFATSLLPGGIHWFLYVYPHVLYPLPWKRWNICSPRKSLHVLSSSRASD